MCLLCGTEWIFKHNKVWACFKFKPNLFFFQIMPLSISRKLKLRGKYLKPLLSPFSRLFVHFPVRILIIRMSGRRLKTL
jgi:hypothetical protein